MATEIVIGYVKPIQTSTQVVVSTGLNLVQNLSGIQDVDNYTNQFNKYARVKTDGTGIEWVDVENQMFGRIVIQFGDAVVYNTYVDNGKTKYPFLRINGKNYLPIVRDGVAFTINSNTITDNGDGTIIVSSTTGDKTFSSFDAEAIESSELKEQLIEQNGVFVAGNWSDVVGEEINEINSKYGYKYPNGSDDVYAVDDSVTLPITRPATPDNRFYLASAVNVEKMRTEQFSAAGHSYQGEWMPNIQIPAKADRVEGYALWEPSIGKIIIPIKSDSFTTSATFQDDISLGLWSVISSANDKSLGLVEAWRLEHPEDTECISAALEKSSVSVKLEKGRIYNVEGGILYTRLWQTLDLNGATVRLKDSANNRLTIIEQDDYSGIVNGVIDGNWQNNNDGAQTWRKEGRLHVELSPESHGIAQRRYQTNNNVVKNATGAFIDNVYIHDTLRSNVLSCGSSNIGTATLENSYCDHQLYVSGSGTIGQFGGNYENLRIKGFCNSDAISVSSTGESTDLSFGKVSLRNITMTPWRADSNVDSDKYGSRWIECRENNQQTTIRSTVHFGSIDIDDTRASIVDLYDNARKVRFRDWHVSIGTLTIRTRLCPVSLVTGDFYVIDVRNESTSVSIQTLHVEIDDDTVSNVEVAAIYAQNRSIVNINAMTGELNLTGLTNNPRWLMCIDSTITVDSLGLTQNKGIVIWNRASKNQSKVTIGADNGISGYTEAIVNTSTNAEINAVINNVTGRSTILKTGTITNVAVDAFLTGSIDLGGSSGILGNLSNAFIGQKVDIIWNGLCQKSGGNIRWLGGDQLPITPSDGSISTLRYSEKNGMWVEINYTAF